MAKKGEPNPLKGGRLLTVASQDNDPEDYPGIQEFYRYVRQGNYAVVAARLAGIPENKLSYWNQQARKDREPYVTFRKNFLAAQAEHESGLVQNIQDSENPKMQLEILERRYAGRWAKVQKAYKEADVQITEFLDYLMDKLTEYPDTKDIVIAIAENYEPLEELIEE